MVYFPFWICLEKSKVFREDELSVLREEKGLLRDTWEEEDFPKNDKKIPRVYLDLWV